MSTVFSAGGAFCTVRACSKPKRAHRADRLDWWRGYADGWAGRPVASSEPWYAAGHAEGAAAAQRRREIMLEKVRAAAMRDAAPAFMAMLERRANAARMANA